MADRAARTARADLAEALSELDERLKPQEIAADAQASVKRAATDARDVLTGKGLPPSAPRKRRAVGLLAVAGGVVVVLLSRALRKH